MVHDKENTLQHSGFPSKKIWEWLIAPSATVLGEENRQQARLLSTLLLVLFVLLSIGLTVLSYQHARENHKFDYIFALTTGLMLLFYIVSRTRYYYRAGILAVLTLTFFPLVEIIVYRLYDNVLPTLVWLILPLLISPVQFRLRNQALLALLDVIGITFLGIISSHADSAMLVLSAGLVVTTSGLLIVIEIYRRSLESERQSELLKNNQELEMIRASLEGQVAERTRSTEAARVEAETANDALEIQMWQVVGLAELARVIREVKTLPSLSSSLIKQVCQYANITVGALFLADGDALYLAGSYAYPFPTNPSPRFTLGSGLVGEAARKRQIITLRDIPDNYLPITSGLGETTPAQIIAVPCIYQEEVVGVMELASLHPFTPEQIQYISSTVESIASALHSAHNQTRVNAILAKTLQQAEVLQAQKEEQHRIAVELDQREEALRYKEQQLQLQKTKLDTLTAGITQTNTEVQDQGEAVK